MKNLDKNKIRKINWNYYRVYWRVKIFRRKINLEIYLETKLKNQKEILIKDILEK